MSDSLRPHESQHARPPCPPPTPGVHSDSRSSSQWCHPAISSSVVPFSSCLQSFPTPGFFSNESVRCIRWPKYWSFNFSTSPSNEHPGRISFRMDWLDLSRITQVLSGKTAHTPKSFWLIKAVLHTLHCLPSSEWRAWQVSLALHHTREEIETRELLITKFRLKLKKVGKPLDHSGMT